MSDLFDDYINIPITPALGELLARPVNGTGGHQSLACLCQGRRRGSVLQLTDTELRKVARYAYAYGGGGWEQVFRAVLSAAWGAGWAGA